MQKIIPRNLMIMKRVTIVLAVKVYTMKKYFTQMKDIIIVIAERKDLKQNTMLT